MIQNPNGTRYFCIMTTQDFEALASQYGLDVDFVQQLHDKVTDKENFARAVKMFVDGTLPFAVATGDAPINVASIRHDVAVNLLALRKTRADKVKEQMEMQRRIVKYYNGCRHGTMTHKGNKSIRETVFIKDGLMVAVGHFEPKQGGIYSANNPVMPDFRWQPHDALARLRKMNRVFYRKVKKAATKSPREWFDFSNTTIKRQ